MGANTDLYILSLPNVETIEDEFSGVSLIKTLNDESQREGILIQGHFASSLLTYTAYHTRSVKTCTDSCCGTGTKTRSGTYAAADPIPDYDACTASNIGCSGSFSCSCSRESANGSYYNSCSWSCSTTYNKTCTSVTCCGYTGWSSWSRTNYCTPSDTCETTTMYHGGS